MEKWRINPNSHDFFTRKKNMSGMELEAFRIIYPLLNLPISSLISF
jgi:hypothetical protein